MPYPLAVFHFRVEWGGTRIDFSEVTGLNMEVQPIEYRAGTDPGFTTTKMPGLKKFGNITLKRGVFASDNDYYTWLSGINVSAPDRRTITISLLNQDHAPVMKWTIHNAWPTKLTSPDMKASGNEAAIETLEVAHEGFTVDNS